MRKDWSHLDQYRGHTPPFHSANGDTFGAFQILHGQNVLLNIIAADGGGDTELGEAGDWEHVSVHAVDKIFGKRRIPNWLEMCAVKDLFWEEDEVVVQFHPAKKDYVNTHQCVLHLWRSKKAIMPTPPTICV